jgi:hypothetical protein
MLRMHLWKPETPSSQVPAPHPGGAAAAVSTNCEKSFAEGSLRDARPEMCSAEKLTQLI